MFYELKDTLHISLNYHQILPKSRTQFFMLLSFDQDIKQLKSCDLLERKTRVIRRQQVHLMGA